MIDTFLKHYSSGYYSAMISITRVDTHNKYETYQKMAFYEESITQKSMKDTENIKNLLLSSKTVA